MCNSSLFILIKLSCIAAGSAVLWCCGGGAAVVVKSLAGLIRSERGQKVVQKERAFKKYQKIDVLSHPWS